MKRPAGVSAIGAALRSEPAAALADGVAPKTRISARGSARIHGLFKTRSLESWQMLSRGVGWGSYVNGSVSCKNNRGRMRLVMKLDR